VVEKKKIFDVDVGIRRAGSATIMVAVGHGVRVSPALLQYGVYATTSE